MKPVAVLGTGFWAPGYPTFAHWLAGEADPEAQLPPAALIPRRQQRRATLIGKMCATTLGQALDGTGLGADEIALILASAGGELQHTFANLKLMIGDPPSSSPLRFGNSVHNAALGQLALPVGNRLFASALALAPWHLVATGLVETIGWVRDTGNPAVLLMADDVWPGETFAPMGAAMLLGAEPVDGKPWLRLHADEPTFTPPAAPDASVRANPSGDAIDLLAALHAGADTVVKLGDSTLRAELGFGAP